MNKRKEEELYRLLHEVNPRRLSFWRLYLLNRRIGQLLAQLPTNTSETLRPYIGPDGFITLYRGTRLAEYAQMMAGLFARVGVWWSPSLDYATKYAANQERLTPGMSVVLKVEIPAKHIKIFSPGGQDAGYQTLFAPAQALPEARFLGRV